MPRFQCGPVFATFVTIGALSLAAIPGSVPGFGGGAASANPYVCMTDDGYGRKRPCSANYKAANPNWRGYETCFTDEGYGRYRPCSANYKAKHKK